VGVVAVKKKTCKLCSKKFTPKRSTTEKVCSLKCAIELARKQRSEAEIKAHRAKRRAFKANDRAHQLKQAQKAVNAFVRERDKNLPCISCGTTDPNIQYAAGHYRTRGGAPHLALSARNIHKQCNRRCNMGLSGNIIGFRQGLVARYGEDFVLSIERDDTTRKHTVSELQKIRAYYSKLLKRIKGD
jgi:hypothetical protein